MMNVMDMSIRRNTVGEMHRGRSEAAAASCNSRNGEAQLQLLNILRAQLAQAAVQQLEPPSSLQISSAAMRASNRSLNSNSTTPRSVTIPAPKKSTAKPMSREQVEQLIKNKYFNKTSSAPPAPVAAPVVQVESLQQGLEQLDVGVDRSVSVDCDVTNVSTADGSASTEKRSNKTKAAMKESATVASPSPVVSPKTDVKSAQLQIEVDSLKEQLKEEQAQRMVYQERCEALEAHLSKVKAEADAGLKKMGAVTSSSSTSSTTTCTTSSSPVAPANSRSFLRSSGRRGSVNASTNSYLRKSTATNSSMTSSATSAGATAATTLQTTTSASSSTSASSAVGNVSKMNEYVDMFNDQSEHSAITFMNDASMSGRYFHSIGQENSMHQQRTVPSSATFLDQSERTMINTYTQGGQAQGQGPSSDFASGHSRMTTATSSYGYSFHSRASEASTVLHPFQTAALRKEAEQGQEGAKGDKTPKSSHGGHGKSLNRRDVMTSKKVDKLGHALDGHDDDDDDDDYSTRTGDYGSQSSSIRSLDSMSSHSSDDDSDHEDSYGNKRHGQRGNSKMSSAVHKSKNANTAVRPSSQMMFQS